MANKNASKVVYYGDTLFDLTGDNSTPDKVLKGYTFHDKTGAPKEGTCDFDVNSQDGTVQVAEMLEGKTGYARGQKVTGTMPNKGAIDEDITSLNQEISVPLGYHDGGGKVGIAEEEKAKLISENIREGVTVLGVEGSMSGTEDAIPQAVEVTPAKTEQQVLPDSGQGYNYLSQVTVKAVPYTETENAAGGITVTIGG